MADRSRAQFTIAQWMGLVAAVAILYALFVWDNAAWALMALAFPTVAVVWLAALVLHYVFNPVLGVGCPYCGGLTLERRAVSSFGERFYRCSKCGVRCRRVALGGWRDASDSRYDAKYERKERAGDPWSGAPGLEDEDLIASKTHTSLIRSKRGRRPENPNGPGLE